jgi:hypothetical protein
MVEKRYVNYAPLHRSLSARLSDYNPEGSSIFIVDASIFDKMPQTLILDIFRRRHILVDNISQPLLAFDREGLSTLAPFKKKVVFQGTSFQQVI